jgi:hypothetical protein
MTTSPESAAAERPWRAIVAGILALGAAVCMRSWGVALPRALWIPTGLLAAVALLVFHRSLGSQLLSRAILWSNLLVGGLVAWAGSTSERPVAGLLALCTGGALLVLGRRGLDDDARAGSFVPVAFRGTLMALMVMALADAQTLVLFGALMTQSWSNMMLHPNTPLLLFGLAGVLSLSIAGIYRLRVWGLLLGAAGCVALLATSLSSTLGLQSFVRWAFAATSALQLLLMLPLGLAMLTGADPSPPRLTRRGLALGTTVIVLLMIASTVGATTRMPYRWASGHHGHHCSH